MTLSYFFELLLGGALLGNVISTSGIGIEFSLTGINSVKHSLIYSLVIFLCLFIGSSFVYLTNLILVSFSLQKFLLPVAFLIFACVVQMAEIFVKKLAPSFFMQVRYFMPTLVGTSFVAFLIAWFVSKGAFLPLICYIFSMCVGITTVLAVVAGIRSDRSRLGLNDNLKGNILSVVIVFVIILVWTAI